jgi:hypothetical protein
MKKKTLIPSNCRSWLIAGFIIATEISIRLFDLGVVVVVVATANHMLENCN